MYCRKCGCELADDAKFCKKCGAVVNGGPQSGNAAPVPAAKQVSSVKADRIDIKLIAAVMFLLVVQLAIVSRIVSAANAGPETKAETDISAAAENTSADSYFDKGIYVGAKVEFGRYEQDGNTQNGPEPIEWDVVASFEDGYLLVSRYILDGLPWDDGSGSNSALDLKTELSYEQSSIRKWIRDSFSAAAFTDEERSMIVPVAVKGDEVLADKKNRYATDCAFLLREDEVRENFGKVDTDLSNSELRCAVTEYAAESGLALDTTPGLARHNYGDSSCVAQWTLRRRYTDPEASQPKVVTVSPVGRFSNAFAAEILGFRPAIYIVQ